MEPVGSAPQGEPHAVVSTGFATERGTEGLPPERTLAKGRTYQFFVEIAPELTEDAIDTGDIALPDLPVGAVLQVALYGFEGELAPQPGADVGELQLVGDGTAIVLTQPGGVEPGQRRLYLPVTTPDLPGANRMRCNIYCRQVLLQSRLVEVEVTNEETTADEPALRSLLDFAVISTLRSQELESLHPRTLSVLVNDEGYGTHCFRFFGGTEIKHDVRLAGQTLKEMLDKGREALREASWNKKTEPTLEEFRTLSYCYSTPTPDRLYEDLKRLARSGFIIWDSLIDPLSQGDVENMRQLMRKPGVIEFKNKESLDLLVPAAYIYDHPLKVEQWDLTICPAFLSARGVTPLATTACFHGECPSYGYDSVVCPSGFWGFRHQIGYSASLTGGTNTDAKDQALVISGGTLPLFTGGASTDPRPHPSGCSSGQGPPSRRQRVAICLEPDPAV